MIKAISSNLCPSLLKYESQNKKWQSAATKQDPEGTIAARAERLNSTQTTRSPSKALAGQQRVSRAGSKRVATFEYNPKLRHTCMHTAVCAAMCTGNVGGGDEEATRLQLEAETKGVKGRNGDRRSFLEHFCPAVRGPTLDPHA